MWAAFAMQKLLHFVSKKKNINVFAVFQDIDFNVS